MDVREERFLATKPLINGFGGAVDCLKLLPNEDACHPVCFSPERLSESRLDEEGVRNFLLASIPSSAIPFSLGMCGVLGRILPPSSSKCLRKGQFFPINSGALLQMISLHWFPV